MYSVEEVAGTLFLKFGNTVLAANIGEQDSICEITRTHLNTIAETMNKSLDEAKKKEETKETENSETPEPPVD
jgi:hypothetical protein